MSEHLSDLNKSAINTRRHSKKFSYNRSDIFLILISFILTLAGILTYSSEGIPWVVLFFSLCFIAGIAAPKIAENK